MVDRRSKAPPDRRPSGTAEDLVGPLYTDRGLRHRWRALLPDDVERALESLLSLPGSDGSTLYPASQFVDPAAPTPDGQLAGVTEIHEALAGGGAEALTIAVWLTAPDDRWGGLSALERLRRNGSKHAVAEAARQDAERWIR